MTTNSPNPVDGDVQPQPVAWAHRLVNKRNGTVHPWVYGSNEKEPSEGDIFRIEVMPLYAAQPAQLFRTVELPQGRLMQVAFETDPVNADMYLCISRDAAVRAIREAGGEVKND